MYKIAFTMAAIGIATLSLSTPAHAGNGSAVGAGLFGFGVGAIVGSALAPQTLCRTPTARLLCVTATGLCRATGARICRAGVSSAPGISMASPLRT